MKLIWVDVDKAKPNSYNPNVMDTERFEALCDFLRTHDAEELDPIWVRNDGEGYEIIDGEHRWKAAKTVGWKRLRAFVRDMDVDSAKAFNVRKNRERGRLDGFKLARLFQADKLSGLTCKQIAQKYGYISKKLSGGWISELIGVADREQEIRDYLKIDASTRVSIYKAIQVLRELKKQEKDEPVEKPELSKIQTDIEAFMKRYREALVNNPAPNVQWDEVNIAIDFFKKLLKEKKIGCPICGENHLQWKCGHEF